MELRETLNTNIFGPSSGLSRAGHGELDSSIYEISKELFVFAERLLQALAFAMDLDKNFFVDCHKATFGWREDIASVFRTLYYPPIRGTKTFNVVSISNNRLEMCSRICATQHNQDS